MLKIRRDFPEEELNFEPWIDKLFNFPVELDNYLVYEEWRTPKVRNDGTSVPSLLNYVVLCPPDKYCS